jgi:hypothetical protein
MSQLTGRRLGWWPGGCRAARARPDHRTHTSPPAGAPTLGRPWSASHLSGLKDTWGLERSMCSGKGPEGPGVGSRAGSTQCRSSTETAGGAGGAGGGRRGQEGAGRGLVRRGRLPCSGAVCREGLERLAEAAGLQLRPASLPGGCRQAGRRPRPRHPPATMVPAGMVMSFQCRSVRALQQQQGSRQRAAHVQRHRVTEPRLGAAA